MQAVISDGLVFASRTRPVRVHGMIDLKEKTWEILLERIREKKCTPFLGAGACAGALPLGGELSRELADAKDYPFQDRADLLRVAQFIAVKWDPRSAKSMVVDRVRVSICRWNKHIPAGRPGLQPRRKKLATSAENEIILWDVATATPLGSPLRKHDDIVRAVAFSPDGEFLASGSDDKSIILWNVATRQLPVVLSSEYSTAVHDLAFSPDGHTLAAASLDTITFWEMTFDSWQCRAAEIAARNLTEEEWKTYLPDEPYKPTSPYGLMLKAHKHALRGEAGEARRDYAEAVKRAAKTKDTDLNNGIPRSGTLDGFADVVLPACDVAIREASVLEKPGC
jgi:hypothetical protein